jgi:hypothetical protein
LQWQEAIFPFWAVVDETLQPVCELPDFAKCVDECLDGRLSASANFNWELAISRAGFTNIQRHDPKIIPQLLRYETDYSQWAMKEVIEKARMTLFDPSKQSLLEDAERILSKYVGGQGQVSYKTAVFIAQKPA